MLTPEVSFEKVFSLFGYNLIKGLTLFCLECTNPLLRSCSSTGLGSQCDKKLCSNQMATRWVTRNYYGIRKFTFKLQATRHVANYNWVKNKIEIIKAKRHWGLQYKTEGKKKERAGRGQRRRGRRRGRREQGQQKRWRRGGIRGRRSRQAGQGGETQSQKRT